jgi:hypothetical protein
MSEREGDKERDEERMQEGAQSAFAIGSSAFLDLCSEE